MSDNELIQTKDSIGRVNGGSVIGHSIIYDEGGGRKSGYDANITYSSEDGYFYLIDNLGNFPSTGNDLYSFLGGGNGTLNSNRHIYDYWNETSYEQSFTYSLNNSDYENIGCTADGYQFTADGFVTTIPIFDPQNTEAIQRYIESGDTSGAKNKDMLDLSAIWTKVYLDGSAPPNITITWGVEKGDEPDHVNVVIYATPTYGAEEGKTELSRILYSWGDSGVSFTWGSLENLMYGGDVPNIIIETNNKGSVNNIATAYVDSDGKSYQPSEETYSADGKNSIQVVIGDPPSDEENSDQKEQEKSEADEKEQNTNINTASLLTRTYQLTREQLQS